MRKEKKWPNIKFEVTMVFLRPVTAR